MLRENNTPSTIIGDDIDKRGNSSDNLENVYDAIQNLKPTGSDMLVTMK